MLTGWLFRARKSPWSTAGVGQTFREAGTRYMEAATGLSFALRTCKHHENLSAKAEPNDVLMQLFGLQILRERLVHV